MRIHAIVLGATSVLLAACAGNVAPQGDADTASVESTLEATGKVDFYVSVKGQKQGQFQGEVTTKAHAGQIAAFRFASETSTPTSATSGLPTGRFQAGPVSITKEFDKTDPLFLDAQANGENLTEVKLTFVRRDATKGNALTDWQTVVLTNARVVDLQRATLQLDDAAKTSMFADTISFEWEKMTITNLSGGATSTIERSAPTQ